MIFFSHRPHSLCICLSLWCLYILSNLIYTIYRPFLQEKPLSQKKVIQFVISHASDNTTSPNIDWGDGYISRPLDLKFWGSVFPVPTKFPPMLSAYRKATRIDNSWTRNEFNRFVERHEISFTSEANFSPVAAGLGELPRWFPLGYFPR